MAIEIVSFPMNSMVMFHGKMLVHQRVCKYRLPWYTHLDDWLDIPCYSSFFWLGILVIHGEKICIPTNLSYTIWANYNISLT